MLKNPFKSIKSRLQKVSVFIIIGTIILAVLDILEVNMFSGWLVINPYYFKYLNTHSVLLENINITFIIICLLFTAIPAWLVLYRLFSKGTSENLKKMMLYRTTFQLIFYFIFAFSILYEFISKANV